MRQFVYVLVEVRECYDDGTKDAYTGSIVSIAGVYGSKSSADSAKRRLADMAAGNGHYFAYVDRQEVRP